MSQPARPDSQTLPEGHGHGLWGTWIQSCRARRTVDRLLHDESPPSKLPENRREYSTLFSGEKQNTHLSLPLAG